MNEKCRCDDGYFYSPHSCGEPTQSACPRCRPEEAASEAKFVGLLFLSIPIIFILIAVLAK